MHRTTDFSNEDLLELVKRANQVGSFMDHYLELSKAIERVETLVAGESPAPLIEWSCALHYFVISDFKGLVQLHPNDPTLATFYGPVHAAKIMRRLVMMITMVLAINELFEAMIVPILESTFCIGLGLGLARSEERRLQAKQKVEKLLQEFTNQEGMDTHDRIVRAAYMTDAQARVVAIIDKALTGLKKHQEKQT
jgi:hypothetical protein